MFQVPTKRIIFQKVDIWKHLPWLAFLEFMPFFRLIARILTLHAKKYGILTFRDKKYRILRFRDKTESYLTALQQNNADEY